METRHLCVMRQLYEAAYETPVCICDKPFNDSIHYTSEEIKGKKFTTDWLGYTIIKEDEI